MKLERFLSLLAMLVGVFGFLGALGCGSSIVAWTLKLGQPQNYVGATLVSLSCGCAAMCCAFVSWSACLAYHDNKFPLKD